MKLLTPHNFSIHIHTRSHFIYWLHMATYYLCMVCFLYISLLKTIFSCCFMTTINFNGKLFNRLFGLCVAWTLWIWIWLEHDERRRCVLCYACKILHEVYVKISLVNIFVDLCVVCNRFKYLQSSFFILDCSFMYRFKNKINRRGRFVWLRQAAATAHVNQPPKIPFVSCNFKIASKMRNESTPKVHCILHRIERAPFEAKQSL